MGIYYIAWVVPKHNVTVVTRISIVMTIPIGVPKPLETFQLSGNLSSFLNSLLKTNKMSDTIGDVRVSEPG